ncbi:hypothetical protein [Ktedonobacter robiniae]|uniref:hypothetical protein n=1 Tax=Ktedonobacter robiniae TaxID=2778365 RepID=UPI0019157815|nr:hypothetical protein [Ktedonobacter robiniae]
MAASLLLLTFSFFLSPLIVREHHLYRKQSPAAMVYECSRVPLTDAFPPGTLAFAKGHLLQERSTPRNPETKVGCRFARDIETMMNSQKYSPSNHEQLLTASKEAFCFSCTAQDMPFIKRGDAKAGPKWQ